jgi:uncharacterized protein YoxC
VTGVSVTVGGIAALVAAGAFLMLVGLLALPILRLRATVDAATRAINDAGDRTPGLLDSVKTTVDNVNTALNQVQTSLDGVNLQLERLDTITGHAQSVTANVANLTSVVTAATSNPLVKVAAFGYGVRRAAAKRRAQDEEKELRATLKQQRQQRRGARPSIASPK